MVPETASCSPRELLTCGPDGPSWTSCAAGERLKPEGTHLCVLACDGVGYVSAFKTHKQANLLWQFPASWSA